jgi:peptidoglycan/xylan/chitin deacetylase (PgdA/CDA1 family)
LFLNFNIYNNNLLFAGNLSVSEIPQFILLTFDDSVLPSNYPYYERLLHQERSNQAPGCPVVATFFTDGRYTVYDLVGQLYGNGSEIASHTRSHP